jgi:membrane-bound serine protease (ClpP class)
MLFREAWGMRLSLEVLIPTLVVVSGFFVAVAGLVFRAQRSKPFGGMRGLVGEVGVVRKSLDPDGKVFVHGELWNAVAREFVEEGSKVKVVQVNNLVLEVEPLDRSKA